VIKSDVANPNYKL